MKEISPKHLELSEHFFRNEYGKMVAVISKYIGRENVETAEDIVQEALLKAVDYWQHNGIPENPQAWLYVTAKNITFNILKRKKHKEKYLADLSSQGTHEFDFSEDVIADEQLRMMLACCHSTISKNAQIALILKILCGFSINEISNAFFTSPDTINKRLVRGRKQLRENHEAFENLETLDQHLEVVLTTIYLLFNEGYNPTQKSELIQLEFCREAIRLIDILVNHSLVKNKIECHALMALMCLNISRFKARLNNGDSIVELEKQDRSLWNQEFINKGIFHLNKATKGKATKGKAISKYMLLANISANHCISSSFEDTNWDEILYLYDSLLVIENSPIARLNRSVALAKVYGAQSAIDELNRIKSTLTTQSHYLLYLTLGVLYKSNNESEKAIIHLNKALSLTANSRNKDFIRKKIKEVVPVF